MIAKSRNVGRKFRPVLCCTKIVSYRKSISIDWLEKMAVVTLSKLMSQISMLHILGTFFVLNIYEICMLFFIRCSDIFNTLIDIRWRCCIFIFSMSFFVSWLLFAVVYYVIEIIHGDFAHYQDEKWTPCISNMHSFMSVFLFSVETQHTIGEFKNI